MRGNQRVARFISLPRRTWCRGNAGPPPGGDIDGGEAEHEQTQHALTPAQFPGLAAVTRAGVRHDPERLFELGMQGIQLTLASQLTQAGRRPANLS